MDWSSSPHTGGYTKAPSRSSTGSLSLSGSGSGSGSGGSFSQRIGEYNTRISTEYTQADSRHPHRSSQASVVSSRISNISDFDPFSSSFDENAFNTPVSPIRTEPWLTAAQSQVPFQSFPQSPPTLHTAASQVSMLTPSEHDLVAKASDVSLASSRSNSHRRSQSSRSRLSFSFKPRRPTITIPEEGDISLVSVLNQPATAHPSTEASAEFSAKSSAIRPFSMQVSSLSALDRNKLLTGGLGVGHERPSIRLHSSDLISAHAHATMPLRSPLASPFRIHDYAALEAGLNSIPSHYETAAAPMGANSSYCNSQSQLPPPPPPPPQQQQNQSGSTGGLLRSLTFRAMPALSRSKTIRNMGQAEANRLGQPVEVIIDEEDDDDEGMAIAADISIMTGPGTLDDSDQESGAKSSLSRAIPVKHKSEYFFPQPDWKPFSMRPMYLWFLVSLSFSLALTLEICIHIWHSGNPLYTTDAGRGMSRGAIFSTRFLPILVSVIFGVVWQMTDYEVKRLEAFYQMSRPGGALASRSINVDYVTNSSVLRPWQAYRMGHWAVMVSSAATQLAVSLVPAFASSSMTTRPSTSARAAYDIVIQPVFAHLLAVTLFVCGAAGFVLLFILGGRRSGLLGDPRGLAGIAAMAVVCHILHDFNGMDVATHPDLHRRLKSQRYMLQNNSLAPNATNPPLGLLKRGKTLGGEDDGPEKENIEDLVTPTKKNPHSVFLRAPGCVFFVVFLLGIAGTVVFYQLRMHHGSNSVTQMPGFMTLLSICAKLLWGNLDTQVRMLEPYYILSKRHAPPKTLTLDYTAIPFGYMPVQALFNGHWIMFLVGFGSVIVELLTVVLSTMWSTTPTSFSAGATGHVTDTEQQQQQQQQPSGLAFTLSVVFSLGILAYMAAVTILVWARRSHAFLPRRPNTIASALSYIHQSKMLCDFEGTSKFTTAQMEEKLKGLNKRYGLGMFKGRDGQTHVGVDEEELSGDYKHGLDYNKSSNPWNSSWEMY
ncbi:hypothetical protein TD95_002740 [Thielaviopsis punctulata]|uniref:Uncharacterized protein n=1 Tax=Thielaviopsis punctulata TaxID=72032 RepID=A0A0F4ZLZ1_9PEZI|nr:hypothetical protein TD95_002740 [Thielaviopsis punctulata]